MLEIFDNVKVVFLDRGNTTNDCLGGPSREEKDLQKIEYLRLFIQKKYQKTISAVQILNTFVNPWKATFADRERRGYELKIDKYIKHMLDLNSIDYCENDIDEMIFQYGSPHIKWDTPNSGVIDLFKYLKEKSIRIGILSNSVMPGRVYKEIYRHYGLANYIDAYVFSYDVGVRKPDPRIFKYACQKMSVAPERCLMIGDTIDKDIMGAKQIGMKTIWYNAENIGSNSREFDLEISNFDDLHSAV